jgi:pyridinium-3,5-biscarboxylic acid mononucleotide synthase
MNPTVTADLGFARIDLGRSERCGFPEVIYGEGKTVEGLLEIVKTLQQAAQGCLVTRVNEAQSSALLQTFPHAEQNRVGRTFWLASGTSAKASGKITIITAGTADLPVAQEAFATVKAMGFDPDLIVDVGVAGLHRLLAQLDRIRQADVIIVVAGMEAALTSVVGGLVACPVIAVPTSVGYGSHFGGLTSLLGMLNSCAANVVVVNIDAGFKAGYVAGLMLRSQQPKEA